MSAWLALGLMMAIMLGPALYFGARYVARRFKTSLILAVLCTCIIPLCADSLGFLPRWYGRIIVGLVMVLGLFLDLTILGDIRIEKARNSPRD